MGPYLAYYYTGRYQDVFNLAEQTINNLNPMTVPAARNLVLGGGQAALMLGDKATAARYFNKALEFYPNWDIAIQGLAEAES